MIKAAIARVVSGRDLTEKETRAVFTLIMKGAATDAQIASLITALRMKGETVAELTGAAKVMREKARKVRVSGQLLDTCGTGGSQSSTFNISTACAFVVSACGINVAKHGNRAVSSQSGSADVLERMGIRIDLSPEQVKECIKSTGIGFLFAPMFHLAMKYAIGPRREIGIRTIFNLLGPLSNPAGASEQLMGVYSGDLVEPMAKVLMNLGVKRAMVVYGLDGVDEVSVTGRTRVAEVSGNKIRTYFLQPSDFGLRKAAIKDLKGGSPAVNAKIMLDILSGEEGPRTDAVLANAAAALVLCGKSTDLKSGVAKARQVLKEGLALRKLESLKKAAKGSL